MPQAYCLKCRKKVDIKDPTRVILKNKRPATSGKCPVCGTKVFRIQTMKLSLQDVAQDKLFWCHDGRLLKNLDELAAALQEMSDETYQHHVTGEKNDFSNWVWDVIGDATLAVELQRAISHNTAAEVVKTRLAQLRAKE
jgi:glycosidase